MTERPQANEAPPVDTAPVDMVHETEMRGSEFKTVPPEWAWVRNQLLEASQKPDFSSKYGLTDDTDSVLVFHGTQRDKAQIISTEGMKAFDEKSYAKPRIFVTASPTMALSHATERGPHDTLRAEGKVDYAHKPEEAVLLAIRVPKDWLIHEPKSRLPLDIPKWIKEAKGLPPDQDNRLNAFGIGLAKEVSCLQQSHEVSDFGIQFPADNIPPEYINVIEPSDTRSIFS